MLRTDLDPALAVKPENLQVTGAFKARGAFNAILRLLQDDPDLRGVVSVSSGNHAQAVAYAATRCGIASVIVIPSGANPAKVARTREFGAEVITEGITFENREEVARAVMAERGLPLVHPFDDWDVIHGQGTAALEILADVPSVAAIVTPVGGGGLISGTAIAARHLSTGTRVFGVEPDSAADAALSLATGELRSLEVSPDTLADGVRVLSLGQRGFEVIVQHRLVDGIMTVTEAEIASATRVAWTELSLAIEPTSALPLAAWLAGKVPHGTVDRPTCLIFSGGNFDPAVASRLLGEAAPR